MIGKSRTSCCFILFYGMFLLLYAGPGHSDAALLITIQSSTGSTVGRYEKYEIQFTVENAEWENPFDPDEIDVRGVFKAPSGKEWEIFGFYDNYQNQDIWKVRFAANESGTWQYVLSAHTPADSGRTSQAEVQVTESEYHGWLQVSPVNPHYFMHDDGTSFYGVGPYYPWGVNNGSSGLGAIAGIRRKFLGILEYTLWRRNPHD